MTLVLSDSHQLVNLIRLCQLRLKGDMGIRVSAYIETWGISLEKPRAEPDGGQEAWASTSYGVQRETP